MPTVATTPFVPTVQTTCPPIPPQPWGTPPVLHYGSQGAWVSYLRAKLCLAVLPWFDKLTFQKVQQFQGSVGLVQDGVVGPATWKALGV